VKIALTVRVSQTKREIAIEDWAMVDRPTRVEPSKQVPHVGQRVVISQEAAGQPIRMNSDHLEIRFQRLFLRTAGQNERDIVLTREDLESIANLSWNVHPNV
jgi:predicted alpha/beta hydrolase